MPVPHTTARRPAFGAYEADLHSGELTKDGKRVRLQAQPFQLLVMLPDRPGQLVLRERFARSFGPRTRLWTSITAWYRHQQDSQGSQRFRRGYRFVAPVTVVEVDPPLLPQEQVAPSPPPAEPVKAPLRKGRFPSVVGVGVAAALLVSVLIAGISTVGDNG
jgi:hypothetical protein